MSEEFNSIEVVLIKGFLNTAKQDLTSFNTLHSVGIYNHSIFHLQQFIEKMSKSFGLLNKSIQVEDIKGDISHNTGKIFTRSLSSYQDQIGQLKKLGEQIPDFLNFTFDDNSIDLSGYVKNYRMNSNSLLHLDSEELFWIESNELKVLIAGLNEIHKVKEEFKNIDFSNFKQNLIEILTKYENLLNQDYTLDKNQIQDEAKFKQIIEHTIKSSEIELDIKFVALNLFFFSKILQNHYEESRYPCLCCGMEPEEKYNKDLGLISEHKLISNQMTTLVNIYESYINKLE